MPITLWKAGELISVVYRNGNYTHNLHATDFKLTATANEVVLSLDFSLNEVVRNKNSNRYLDVMELLEHRTDIKSVQISMHKQLAPFDRAAKNHPDASLVLELRFAQGQSYRLPCVVRGDDLNLWFDSRLPPG